VTSIVSIRRALRSECRHDFLAVYRRRNTGTRAGFARLIQVLTAVMESHFPNCTSLAKRLGYSSKTIMRDIQYLRSAMGVRIEWDALRRGYFVTLKEDRG